MRSDKLMTIRELSEYLNVKTHTIYAWTSTGEIPVKRANRMLRFDKSEIDVWLKSRQTPGFDPARIAKKIVGRKIVLSGI